jgi:molybdate transport system substrate-binding protein
VKRSTDFKILLPTLILILLLFFGYLSLDQRRGEKIVAFCGAASKPALEAAATEFEGKTGIRVELHFGGSGDMLSKMILSKGGDLYIPGSPDYMTKAVELGAVDPPSIKVLAYLVPAIIVPKGNPKNIAELKDLAKPGLKIAIADPASVCVGAYAVEVLKFNGLYEQVSRNVVTLAESCSKLAALVTIGGVDVVIGWDVFYRWNTDKTDIIYIEPKARIPKLAYVPAAISSYSKNPVAAGRFLNFLCSQEGRRHFEIAGYLTTETETKKYAPNAEVHDIMRLL